MTGRDLDTDPSTPGAIRGAGTADTDPTDPIGAPGSAGNLARAGASAQGKKPNTDPGLGPGAQPAGPPVPVRTGGRQDTVEMLLDGMSAPQPERQKTTPQSAGEAAASYHAEHPVHPARTEPDEQPKVIVERPPLVPTVKVDRAKLQAVIAEADARRRAAEAEAAAKAPVPVTTGPKALIAAVAGLLVVLVIFLAARGKSSEEKGTDTPSVTPATAAAPETATATPTAADTATATATTAVSPAGDTTEAPAPTHRPTTHVPVTALPEAPATATAPKPRPRPTATSDLGEFKTTFH